MNSGCTLRALAEQVGGTLRAATDPDRLIRGIAPLAQAGADDLSWLGNAKYRAALDTTQAGAVLIAPQLTDVPEHLALIDVDDPDRALIAALKALAPTPATVPLGTAPSAVLGADCTLGDDVAIGSCASIGQRVRIGARTQIHPGVSIGDDTSIGSDCVVWPNVVIRERTEIGDRVIIHPNATIGADGFGFLYRDGQHLKIPQIGAVRVEDDVEIGANATIDRARSGFTVIGRGAKIDNLVQVAHNVQIGPGSVLAAQVGISGSTRLGAFVVLGGQVGVADHVTIGDGTQVGAQAGVPSDLPGGLTVLGAPAQEIKSFWRQTAAIKRLPEVRQALRDLEARVKQLESSAND